jgi:hypothetical protein
MTVSPNNTGINPGWLEFLPEQDDPATEEVSCEKEEYYSYFHEAVERLVMQALPSDPVPPIEPIRGMEVGDDRKDESLSPTGLALSLAVQSSVFKMKTSEDDTFISNSRSNFCEVTTVVPRSMEGSYHTMRKRNTTRNLEFVDVVAFRLVEPVTKGKGADHSSSKSGKASLAGPKQAFAREDLQENMYLMNFLQDGILVTSRAPEPKYLPTLMGGSGAPSLYGDHRNQYLYMISYKGSGYSRVYGTAVNEVRNTLYSLELEKGYVAPYFTMKLRDKQEYLYGTYAEKVFVPTSESKSQFAEKLPPPIYEAGGTTNDLSSVEARLMAARVLVTRTQAEIEHERTMRNGSVLFGTSTYMYQKEKAKRENRKARSLFEGAISANTAFNNLLLRQAQQKDVNTMMKDPSFRVVLTGAKEYTLQHALWVHEGCKSDTYTLRDIFKAQDMFLRSEVSTEEEMKVSGISRLWVRNGRNVITETRAEVGLWQVSNDMQVWAASMASKLAEKRLYENVKTLSRSQVLSIYYENRENVADDPLILQHVLSLSARFTPSEQGVIFSQDRRLAKALANRSGMTFYRISPEVLLRLVPEGDDIREKCMQYELPTLVNRDFSIPGTPIRISVVDQGSLDVALMTHRDDIKLPGMSWNNIFEAERVDMGKSTHNRYETYVYKPIGARSKQRFSKERGIDGRMLYERFIPQKSTRSKLPKFEQYRSGNSSGGNSKTSCSSGSLPRGRRLPSETA